MTRDESQRIVDHYIDWVRSGIETETVGDAAVEIITPFLDPHNDHIAVYAQRTGNRILLTDDGATISDLALAGVDLTLERRRAALDRILRVHGIHRVEDRLEVEARDSDVGKHMHSLLQTMLAVGDLRAMARSSIASLFDEDVRAFLDMREVRFSPSVSLLGRSGFIHAVDFLIPKSKERPERVVQAIAKPDRQAVHRYLWVLTDTKEARSDDAQMYAVIDDREDVSPDLTSAFENYDVRIAPWSLRDSWVAELAA